MENSLDIFDTTIERGYLGTILLDNKLIYKSTLSPSDFWETNARLVYSAMLDLRKNDIPIDQLTLIDYLKNSDVPASYVFALTNYCSTADMFETYEKILHEKSVKRQIYFDVIKLKEQIENGIQIDEVFETLRKLLGYNTTTTISNLNDMLGIVYNQIIEQQINEYIPSGIQGFDELFGGFPKQSLIVVACRPSVGKSTLALQLSYNFIKNNYKVLFISLEMSAKALILRMISQISKIPHVNLQKNKLTEEQHIKLVNAFQTLYDKPLYLFETSDVSIYDIENLAHQHALTYGLDVVIIDYLTLMKMPHSEKKVDAIGEITRRLKLLAKKLNIVIILLSQLNRNVEERTEKRPMLSDLRDSGNVEQDSDMVLLLWRKLTAQHLLSREGELIIAKNRDGQIGTIPFYFNADILTFEFKEVQE